ncbi:hypothetical protein HYALB_00009064 [Hymenoscyphus albidus]|uniref:Thiol-specific monooxygenase n=1 Tax=Hymenoscyphus albidus TaxID=595503 RepID=A0A9N9LN85_9HELO|nr:hypothetical protein HYALB_00009064 [Hymenoscyphus albidus]
MKPIKSIAIIGCGPAGLISIDALAQEQVFDTIRVFERRERPGGCWIDDPEGHIQQLPDLDRIAARNPEEQIQIPDVLPIVKERSDLYRFDETSIYPTLETNIDAQAMEFSQEPFPSERTAFNVERHGKDSPFRHWKAVRGYLESLVNRRGYEKFVSYGTFVELVEKDQDGGWILTLRQVLEGGQDEKWWTERFDAVVVASGHYHVPFIPHVDGLSAFATAFHGSVQHSKSYRKPEVYKDKRVVVVGASISGPDISFNLADIAEAPVHSVVRGRYHPYFGDYAFQHPNIFRRPPITHVVADVEKNIRTVYFEDGTTLENVDHIIFATGYSWTLPFLPTLATTIRNNRLPNLYQHVFPHHEETLVFVGAIAAGFTFKVFEWQAVLVARYLAGRIQLPPIEERIKWEEDRIIEKGDGVPFTAIYPKFEEYFEEIREMAGEPDGKGRKLPVWEKQWREGFDAAHLVRIAMWKRGNERARERIEAGKRKSEGISTQL